MPRSARRSPLPSAGSPRTCFEPSAHWLAVWAARVPRWLSAIRLSWANTPVGYFASFHSCKARLQECPMFRNALHAVLLVLLATAALDARLALGADPPAITTVQVRDMCCNGCARKIAARLYEIRGVTTVRC